MNTELSPGVMPHQKVWAWFTQKAQSKYALLWLAVICFSEPIFLPLMPELFLSALILARPRLWRVYLVVAILSAVLGAAVAFLIASFLFHQVGEVVLNLYGLKGSFGEARQLLRGHVLLTMILASYTLVPDKVFIYAAGFLGVHFVPFIGGFFVGRAVRLSLSGYLVSRYGQRVIPVAKKYFLWISVLLLTVLLWYGIVHVGGAHGGAAPL